MHGEYHRIYELAMPHLNIRKNDIHTAIVCRYAETLLTSEPGDEAVAIPAAICHDIGWINVPEELHLKAFGPSFDPALTRLHEVEGVRLAREILSAVRYDLRKTEEILSIIDGHDTRLTPLTPSDRIVKDADKLFRFDRIGLAIDADRFNIEQKVHADWLGQQIDRWFFTETGKKLAREEIARFGQ